jgi:L-ascorbate metabolism protein UlaG (beta-lactamase superfamily)
MSEGDTLAVREDHRGYLNVYGTTWRQPLVPLLKWRFTRVFNRRKGSTELPDVVKADPAAIVSDEAHITWIGHATFVVRLGGKIVVTDPVWAERIYYLVRLQRPGVAIDALPTVDVVTVSHNHHDHLHLPTLVRLHELYRPTFLVPEGTGRLLERRGIDRVVEMRWWEHRDFDDLRVSFVPSQHWSARGPFDINRSLWGGFVYQGSDGSAYHSGDTAYEPRVFRDIGRRFDSIGHAMLPIGAYDPEWFLQTQHMGPEDAARALDDLGAERMVAMHYGTYELTDEPIGEPLERILAAFDARGDRERLWTMAIGETRSLARRRQR